MNIFQITGVFMFITSSLLALEPTRTYIANDDHTDFMWTADEDTYAEEFVKTLDFHLKLADETAGNPVEFQNKFNCDGSYWIWNYEQKKSPAEFEKLIDRVRDGTITVPLNLLVSCYGAQPVESTLRGMYYAGRLERRYDIRFPIALAMENQTLPLGLSSLFAGSGAKYSWRWVCGCASKLSNKSLGERDEELYWYTGHDGQRLMLKWYSLGVNGMGTYTEAGGPSDAIKSMEGNADFQKRYSDPNSKAPYTVFGLFGFGGDDLARRTGVTPPLTIPAVPGLQKVVSSGYCDHFFKIAKELTTPDRKVVVSNEVDFFVDFESKYGATLASQTLTYGNEWDLYSASMSETSARAKRSVEKLRSAEFLSTLVSLKYPDFMKRHMGARDKAFNSMGLFWEHNWTADGPVSRGQRAAWEELQASTIEYYVNSIYSEGIIRLGGLIPKPENANRFFVANCLGWQRTDYADFSYVGSANIHVMDMTSGKVVPHQIITLAGTTKLRILASDVPGVGYKVYEIQTGPGELQHQNAAESHGDHNDILENELLKITVDQDGAIRSFIDKRNGDVEYASSIDGSKINDIAPDSNDGGQLTIVNPGPVSVTLKAHSTSGIDHTTYLTVYRNSDRVDIQNEINANFSDIKYWSFAFKFDAPSIRSEEVGSINLNKLKSEGGDYADRNARYDHITVNHFVDISDGESDLSP